MTEALPWLRDLALVVLVTAISLPPLILGGLWCKDRMQRQHAVLRNFPLLGRIRYLLEHVGPELRQYLFESDRGGRPFSRDEYQGIVHAAKYLSSLISFGSRRDFQESGWYLRNALFPTLAKDLAIDQTPSLSTRRYRIRREGLFTRSERSEDVVVAPWTLSAEFAPLIGADLAHPWRLEGLIGMSAMSYGALGSNAISALSHGLGRAPGTWMNTGEGGVSSHHLSGGADLVMQIGPGLFGVRTPGGEFSWDAFGKKAALSEVVGFELKLHQGAKIRGGHIEGSKVVEEIAAIRGVPVGKTIDSPSRFEAHEDLDDLLDWIAQLRRRGGKPVGMKLVVGGPGSLDELALAMSQRGDGPDWVSIDGSEGGSGATYQEMADSVGLPLQDALIEADDAFRRHGVRERLKIFASGKMVTADRIALALCWGADAVQLARPLMITVGCIQARKCHANTCPVGVATTNPRLMKALVVSEKEYRVLNYMTTLRAGLAGLTSAAGLRSPTEFRREHAIHRSATDRPRSAADLFPYPSD